ncbi:M48 family metallopeptidase [Chloroflexota bacterium]
MNKKGLTHILINNSTTINIDGIGPVLFEKSRRAKRLIISIKTSKYIRVAIPNRSSLKKALEFINLKQEWIQRNVAIIRNIERSNKVLEGDSQPIDRADASRKLKDRLRYLAKEHEFMYNKASVRNQRTRWGSCSYNNNISLNAKLVLLPKDLIDYVILHELVHTQIHNHSNDFWVLLDRYVEDGKKLDKRLRANNCRIL